jgi:hypothetical protein
MDYKKVLTLLLFLLVFAFIPAAFSQTNYADVKVDELTDTQIRQLMQRAESIGYNDAQLEQMAAAQGMPAAEIQKLRVRVQKIRTESGNSGSASGSVSGMQVIIWIKMVMRHRE